MPTPGLSRLIVTRPSTRAMLVTTSKYTMALMAMRATLPRSRTLAMPCVTVQKMISPTTIWIRR